MPSTFAIEKAAKSWGRPSTQFKIMDTDLATAFAEVIDEVSSRPWLGNATTAELIDELRARCEVNGTLDYKTVQAI